LAAQIALGGWVSSNYAVMACPDFPLCQGAWMPAHADFAHGFTLWRSLGMTGGEDAKPIPFEALVAVHWSHRLVAAGAAVALGWLAWRACRVKCTRRTGTWLAALLALQLASGMSNVIFQWPLLLAVMHSGGAAALLVLVLELNYRAWQPQMRRAIGRADEAAPSAAE
jgi:cytochrome c oxidase assembly protein subunit 15